jgi:hypothetical protein
MRTAFVLICASILLLALAAPLMADGVKMKDNPKCKQWHSWMGEWKAEVEDRETPGGVWQKLSIEVKREWILEGTVVKTSGRNSNGVSFIELTTYDPKLQTHIFSGFDSNGGHIVGTSGGWDGMSFTGNWKRTTPEGAVLPGSCTFNFSSDFKSLTLECQLFTDGKWWVGRKGKATKIE